jgi:hypothetical protein
VTVTKAALAAVTAEPDSSSDHRPAVTKVEASSLWMCKAALALVVVAAAIAAERLE